MAAETVTDMKGNVVKMEADFSQSVDKMLPECEELVKVSFCPLIFQRPAIEFFHDVERIGQSHYGLSTNEVKW